MPPCRAQASEKRCRLEVAAVAKMREVLDMVKLELDVEGEALALEFAGETLPLDAPVHLVGLRDDDTVMLVPPGGENPDAAGLGSSTPASLVPGLRAVF